MRLQGAIFDMDGTLLDSMPVWQSLGSDMLRRQGREPEPGLDEKLRTMSLRQSAEYCRARYDLPQTAEEIVAMTDSMVDDFYRSRVTAKPGVDRFLSLLKMQGVWMYVATATDRAQAEAALEHTKLRDYFRGIITCTEAGHGKDDPEIFEKAMRRLHSNKKDTVVFEDSLHAIRAAKAAGFRVAGVYDAFNEADQDAIRAECDYYIRAFEDWTKRE